MLRAGAGGENCLSGFRGWEIDFGYLGFFFGGYLSRDLVVVGWAVMDMDCEAIWVGDVFDFCVFLGGGSA